MLLFSRHPPPLPPLTPPLCPALTLWPAGQWVSRYHERIAPAARHRAAFMASHEVTQRPLLSQHEAAADAGRAVISHRRVLALLV